MSIETVTVPLPGREYDILIGPDLLGQAGAQIVERFGARRLFIVADRTAAKFHLSTLQGSLHEAGLQAEEPIMIPPGEGSKSFTHYSALCEQLLAAKPDRSTMLIALGGGVVGDLAGFAAATLLRGIDFIQMPTTLLSQVDSSVGGKTGINAKTGKNLVGVFHQPRLVIADTTTLDTLPRRQLLSGYAEIVKHALIVDAEMFDWLELSADDVDSRHFDQETRTEMIRRSCQIKAGIVTRDEHETGERALLNFGHTFGHGLEALTGYGGALTHGEGVAIGTVLATRLSVQLALCPPGDLDRVLAHFHRIGLPTTVDPSWGITPASLLWAMKGDKKNAGTVIRPILTRGIGMAFRSDGIDDDILTNFLAAHLP